MMYSCNFLVDSNQIFSLYLEIGNGYLVQFLLRAEAFYLLLLFLIVLYHELIETFVPTISVMLE